MSYRGLFVAGKGMKRAFTLIEVMIAVAILVVVMGISWGSYAVSMRQQEKMQHINERLHGVEQAINRLVRELSVAFITQHGRDESQTSVRYKTGFLGEEDRIDFTSLSNVRMFENEKVGDQCELSYYIRTIRNDEGRQVDALVRRIQAPINDEFDRGGTIMAVLEDVRRFRLQYWDDEKAKISVGDDGWVDSWDTEKAELADRLPSRVRIEVEIDDPMGSDQPMVFTTQAEIHLTEALSF